MKKYYIYSTLLLIGMLGFLSSCQEDVDLTNIDTRSELNVGVASPLGSISVALSDVFLNPVGSNFFIDADGTISYRDTSHFELKFQEFDWKKYAYKTDKVFKLPSFLSTYSGSQLPFDLPLPLEFDFALELKDLNIDTEKERFDSVLLDYLILSSKIEQDGINLKWDWVDSITINLGPQCSRPAGLKYFLYKKNDPAFEGRGFGKELPSNIDNFSICLMKNRDLKPGINTLREFNENVVDTVKMQLGLYLTIPERASFTMDNNAAIKYHLDFGGLKPLAVWGYFKPAESMSLKDSIDVVGSWTIGEKLSEMSLPFAAPEISFNIATELAANWEISSDMLYTTNSKGERGWSSINGQRKWKLPILFNGDMGAATIGQKFNYSFMLNNTDSLGHIDSLFSISPDRLVYQFGFNFLDQERYPQVRVTPNTDVDVEMRIQMPMIFNQNIRFTYADTLRNISLGDLSLESTPVDDAKLAIVFNAYNEMPITIKGYFQFLDENEKDLNIFEEPLVFAAQDSSKLEVDIQSKNIDKMRSAKNLVIKLIAEDGEAYKANPANYPVRLTEDQKLKLKLGLIGNVGAVLNNN